jgi:hypothetical protein
MRNYILKTSNLCATVAVDLQVVKVVKRIRLIKKMDPIFRTHFKSYLETKNECLIAVNFISVANTVFIKEFFTIQLI